LEKFEFLGFMIDYPGWFILLCLLLGAVYAGILYLRERLLEEVSDVLKWTMAAFRFVMVSIVAFLLLEPYLENKEEVREMPMIVIAQDNSQSLTVGDEADFYRNKYKEDLQQFRTKLAGKYEVRTYTFGNMVKQVNSFADAVDFEEKQTDLHSLFREIRARYYNRNLGAVVLASDGVFNLGESPFNIASKLNSAIYTVALGDTTVKKDLMISDVVHNKLAYEGNDFPLEIIVEANRMQGESSILQVKKKGEVLFSKNMTFNNNSFLEVVPVKIEARGKGTQSYVVEIVPVEGELTEVNNRMEIFIDVLEGKQKILLLAASPHKDIDAIASGIEANQNYKVESVLASDFKGKVEEYSLVVLHQLPSANNNAGEILSQIFDKNIPVLFVLGSQTNFNEWNSMKLGLSVIGFRGTVGTANGYFDKSFTLFTLEDKAKKAVAKFPPLNIPFGTYKTNNSVTPLFKQKIGLVETENPLMLFHKHNNAKLGVIVGEGIWRWQILDYATNGDNKIFNEIVTKTVQYLSAKEDKSRFRVFSKGSFMESEPIVFEAELYNDSYELVNEPEVNMTITDKDGTKYTPGFDRTASAYRLNYEGLPGVGEYSYEATTTYNDKEYKEKGVFSVSAVQVEMTNSVANHQLLYNLATKNNGTMYYPNQFDALYNQIMEQEDILPISYFKKKRENFIDNKWTFLVLLILLGAEWFMRKRNGAY
jgi:hypothetical protein